MARFQTVIKKARFSYSGISPQQMQSIAQVLADDIRSRILRAEDAFDNPAPTLKNGNKGKGYQTYKARRNPPAIRNWQYTGRTLRSLKVLQANQNRALIGFTDPHSNMVAAVNNRRWRQFGVSPRNRRTLIEAYRNTRRLSVVAA